MDLIQYSSILLVSFLGIISGFFLSLIAPEELKPGKKYFDWIARIILFLIMFFFITYTKSGIFHYIYLLIIIFIVLIARDKYLDFSYPLFSIVLFFSIIDKTLLLIQSSLIFILGLVIASMFMMKYEKKEAIMGSRIKIFGMLLLRYVLFLVIGLIFFVFN
jgi:predicted Na+-dependent transporter